MEVRKTILEFSGTGLPDLSFGLVPERSGPICYGIQNIMAGCGTDERYEANKVGGSLANSEMKTQRKKEGVPDLWVSVGVPALLLLAYAGAWLLDILSEVEACQSSQGMIFMPGECGADPSYIPALLMTIAYAWSALTFIVYGAMRRWGSAVAMMGVGILLGLVHLGSAILSGVMV